MSLLFREWKRDILNFSEWTVATRAALSQKLRRVWLKPGLSHCEKTLVSQLPFRMWNPGCDLSRWATSAYCGNAAITETHKSPEKSIRTVSMVERIQMQGSVTFECDFFFFSNRMVCTKYADGWKWPQCLLSSLIAERFLEADLFSISLHLYLRGLGSVWKPDRFKIRVGVHLSSMKTKLLDSPKVF